jgi:hypothetical protein
MISMKNTAYDLDVTIPILLNSWFFNFFAVDLGSRGGGVFPLVPAFVPKEEGRISNPAPYPVKSMPTA